MKFTPLDTTNLAPLNFLLVGVGGQGTILASDILAEAGIQFGYDVKKAEIHGMSQRGGSVVTNLRWAERVYSPIIPPGGADVLAAFEKLEAVRFLEYLRPGGLAVVNEHEIQPVTVSSGKQEYPPQSALTAQLAKVTSRAYWVDCQEVAESLGNARTANVVLTGVLGGLLGLDPVVLERAVEMRVPARYREVNLEAIRSGYRKVSVF